MLLVVLSGTVLASQPAQAAIVNVVQNSTFTGTTNNWPNWTKSSTGNRVNFTAFNSYTWPNSGEDNIGSLDLTQTGLAGLKSGPGALGAAQMTLNIGWNTCAGGSNASLEVYVAGMLYATFTTRNATTTAITTYSNGATGTASGTIAATTYQTWTYSPWVINLPTSVAASGDVKLSFVQTASGCVDDISLRSITVDVYRPTLQLTKTSLGSTGSFSFTGTNGWGTTSITTVTAGTSQAGTTQTLAAASTATTITEVVPAGYVVSAINCTGLGSGGTYTPNLLSATVTLDAASTAGNSAIICNFTDVKLPTVQLKKISVGGTGAFSFTGNNGFGADNITTTVDGTAANGTVKLLASANTVTTITETIPATYIVSAINCSGMGSGTATYNQSTGTIVLNAQATAPGNNVTCTYTNQLANPKLTVSKTASPTSVSAAGQTINYTIFVQNTGNVNLTGVTVSDLLGAVICPPTGTSTISTINPGQTISCTMSYVVPQSVFNNNGGGDGKIDNTATATTTYNSSTVTASSSAQVTLNIITQLSIVKSANTSGEVQSGQIITYTFEVKNTGNVPLTNVAVNDTMPPIRTGTFIPPSNETLFTDVAPAGDSTDSAVNGSWDVLGTGDTIKFTAQYIVNQHDIDNP